MHTPQGYDRGRRAPIGAPNPRNTTTNDLTTTETLEAAAAAAAAASAEDGARTTAAGGGATAETGEPTGHDGGHDAAHDPGSTFRHSYSRDRSTLIRRLRRIEGQVRGIERMIEREEYCVDILQQTAALKAAVESVSLLILEDHVQGCVRTAAEHGDADRYVEEVLDVVRRSLGRPLRTNRA